MGVLSSFEISRSAWQGITGSYLYDRYVRNEEDMSELLMGREMGADGQETFFELHNEKGLAAKRLL